LVVGLAGCGNWGRHVLRDLASLGCEVAVVARSRESRARAEEGGAAAIVETVAGLPRVDGVVVATPTSTHAEVIEEALGFGVPVFAEKPLCDDAVAAEHLAALAPDRLFVMDKWRYHAGVLELAAIARDGRLGAVAGLTTARLGWGTSHDDVDPVWVLAPHDLSIALEVLGVVPTPRSAAAQWVGRDAVWLSGVLSGDSGWHCLVVSARSPDYTRRIELHCEQGVAVLGGGWDEHVTVFHGGTEEPEAEQIEVEGELPLLAELRAFVEHLGGGPPPKSSAAEGAAVVRTIATLRELAGQP
jgi:predicted dehydrogenase